MRDPERLKRSNMILIGIVILCLLYGLIVRIQKGDDSFYLFGFKVFGSGAEVTQEAGPAEEAPADTVQP